MSGISFSKQSPRQLDRWHKVEDNSGVTQFWPVIASIQRVPRARSPPAKQPIAPTSTNHYSVNRGQQTLPIWSVCEFTVDFGLTRE